MAVTVARRFLDPVASVKDGEGGGRPGEKGLHDVRRRRSGGRARLTPEEQQIVEELPFGFSGNSCETANNPPPGAVASLMCGQDAGLATPLGGTSRTLPTRIR